MQAQEQQVQSELEEVKKEITRVEKEIEEVKKEIEKVERKIENVEERLDASSLLSEEDKQYLRQEKSRLRQKKSRLRQKKSWLRKDELRLLKHQNQLRETLLVHRNRLPAASAPENRESTIATRIAEALEMLKQMHQEIVIQRVTHDKSPASLGEHELARIRRDGKLFDFDATEGQPSALSDKSQSALQQLQTEHEVVAFLTPVLEEIFGKPEESTIVVVNSEEYQWLMFPGDPNYNRKPDLFVCHKAFFKPRKPFHTDSSKLLQLRNPMSLYGVLANWRNRRFVELVCEARLKISNAALGEIINYGAHLCFKDGPVMVRLVLFDTQEFWLVEVVRGAVSSIQKCQWTRPGSRSLLQNFALRHPLIELLDEACHHFQLRVEENSFLGNGGFGVVFCVRDRNHRALALKIVPDGQEYINELELQIAATEIAYSKCPDVVVALEPDGYKRFDEKGAVLLLSEVGDHYSNLKRSEIIQALKDLHAENILHGNVKVEHVVSINGKPKWIDLRMTSDFQAQNVAGPKNEEMRILTRSLDRVYPQ